MNLTWSFLLKLNSSKMMRVTWTSIKSRMNLTFCHTVHLPYSYLSFSAEDERAKVIYRTNDQLQTIGQTSWRAVFSSHQWLAVLVWQWPSRPIRKVNCRRQRWRYKGLYVKFIYFFSLLQRENICDFLIDSRSDFVRPKQCLLLKKKLLLKKQGYPPRTWSPININSL